MEMRVLNMLCFNSTYAASSANLPAIQVSVQAVIKINTMCNVTIYNETPPPDLTVTFDLQNSRVAI
jgi:hypothetical protein